MAITQKASNLEFLEELYEKLCKTMREQPSQFEQELKEALSQGYNLQYKSKNGRTILAEYFCFNIYQHLKNVIIEKPKAFFQKLKAAVAKGFDVNYKPRHEERTIIEEWNYYQMYQHLKNTPAQDFLRELDKYVAKGFPIDYRPSNKEDTLLCMIIEKSCDKNNNDKNRKEYIRISHEMIKAGANINAINNGKTIFERFGANSNMHFSIFNTIVDQHYTDKLSSVATELAKKYITADTFQLRAEERNQIYNRITSLVHNGASINLNLESEAARMAGRDGAIGRIHELRKLKESAPTQKTVKENKAPDVNQKQYLYRGVLYQDVLNFLSANNGGVWSLHNDASRDYLPFELEKLFKVMANTNNERVKMEAMSLVLRIMDDVKKTTQLQAEGKILYSNSDEYQLNRALRDALNDIYDKGYYDKGYREERKGTGEKNRSEFWPIRDELKALYAHYNKLFKDIQFINENTEDIQEKLLSCLNNSPEKLGTEILKANLLNKSELSSYLPQNIISGALLSDILKNEKCWENGLPIMLLRENIVDFYSMKKAIEGISAENDQNPYKTLIQQYIRQMLVSEPKTWATEDGLVHIDPDHQRRYFQKQAKKDIFAMVDMLLDMGIDPGDPEEWLDQSANMLDDGNIITSNILQGNADDMYQHIKQYIEDHNIKFAENYFEEDIDRTDRYSKHQWEFEM